MNKKALQQKKKETSKMPVSMSPADSLCVANLQLDKKTSETEIDISAVS